MIADLTGVRAGDGWCSPGDIARTFELLRLPRPGNVSQSLSRLLEAQLVVRRTSGGSWSLTPEGKERVRELVGQLDVGSIEGEIGTLGSAELSQAQHPLIPPELAPVRFAVPIQRLLGQFPFERNVFCMTRFPRDEQEEHLPDPVKAVIGSTREALAQHGLRLHLASDRSADDELFGNIAGHMWACKYGIGLFETRYGRDFNDNLQIEVGAMLMTGRRVALLKDEGTPDMPTDFVGHIYKPVDFEDLNVVNGLMHAWTANDLGLGPCASCPANDAA